MFSLLAPAHGVELVDRKVTFSLDDPLKSVSFLFPLYFRHTKMSKIRSNACVRHTCALLHFELLIVVNRHKPIK